MNDTESQSEELFKLYEAAADREFTEEEPSIDPRTGKPLEEIYGASQWQLIWRKFIRNKAAVIGGIIILIFYVGALFADFLVPYTLTTRFTKHIHIPPQRVYLFNEGKFQPFVYDLNRNLMKTYDGFIQ